MQFLEQLIYYGADVNCQNYSCNTPLHVCAIYNQVWHAHYVQRLYQYTGWLKKSKLLYCVNSLLFLSYPVHDLLSC